MVEELLAPSRDGQFVCRDVESISLLEEKEVLGQISILDSIVTLCQPQELHGIRGQRESSSCSYELNTRDSLEETECTSLGSSVRCTRSFISHGQLQYARSLSGILPGQSSYVN